MDGPKTLKYDYTYKPPGYDTPKAHGQRSPIEGLLSTGEHVLWTGKPPQKLLMLNAADLFLVPFFLFWTGFACFWELAALGILLSDPVSPGICMPLFGLPFVAIGFLMLGARFVGEPIARRSTYYALTDRRVLIVTGGKKQIVTSVPLNKIENVGLTLHRNGTGTLNFAGGPNTMQFGGFANYTSKNNGQTTALPVFDHIPEPKKIYDMVMKAQDDLTVRQHGYKPEQ